MFQLDDSSLSLAMGARNARFDAETPVMTHPGKLSSLPLAMYDEFNHVMHSEFALRVQGSDLMHLDNYFTVNNKTRVYRRVNQTATLVLSTPQLLYNIDYYVHVKLLQCPPGFYFKSERSSRWCSANYSAYYH